MVLQYFAKYLNDKCIHYTKKSQLTQHVNTYVHKYELKCKLNKSKNYFHFKKNIQENIFQLEIYYEKIIFCHAINYNKIVSKIKIKYAIVKFGSLVMKRLT